MKGRMGAVVAMDPRTGEILAMHSLPGFDPTEMTSRGQELWKSFIKSNYGPLRNKTIQDHFPAGSTFKVFTSLAALEAGVITPQTTYNCPGYFKFGKRIYSCHLKSGHGNVNLHDAIRGSCDVYFYNVATRLSIDVISKMANLFGLGKRSGIALFNEAPGLMPTESWKQETFREVWQAGETLSASIGQGYNLVTPIQLAEAYSTLVNGGNLYRPYVVSRVERMDGTVVRSFSPELLANTKVNQNYVEDIKDALQSVINDPRGTAYKVARSKEIEIGGKSGTAQVISLSRDDLFKPCRNLPFEKRHHAWFVGYAPKKDPEIVVAVLGMHECGGGVSSGPVVKTIIEKWWEKKKAREALKGPQPATL
jgi:penicillin-binding protein 2